MLTGFSVCVYVISMPHKNSILICQMTDGTQDIYVDGVQITVGAFQKMRVEAVANSKATTASVIESLRQAVATLTKTTENKPEV